MSHRPSTLLATAALLLFCCSEGDFLRQLGAAAQRGERGSERAQGPRGLPGEAGARADCPSDDTGLSLPSGFCASVFADELGPARHLVVTPRGDVYVAIQDARDGSAPGGVVALRDNDHDGRADEIERFGEAGAHGIAYQSGQLYVAEDDRVVRYQLGHTLLLPTSAPVTIVAGLPRSGDHAAKSVVVRGDDLFVNIGSASNACQRDDASLARPSARFDRQRELAGLDPCPELALRAGVWRFAAAGFDQTQADGERFVTGTRDLPALAVRPHDRQLYGLQSGRDQLAEDWPALFSAQEDSETPAEELLRLERTHDYGWPYCHYDTRLNQKVLAPEYGGDGVRGGRCAEVDDPIAIYPAHWAPQAMLFYRGRAFPARYREGAFISFHGARWTIGRPGAPPGYRIVFQPFDGERAERAYETFAEGFAGSGRPLPAAATYRPVGLAEGSDGALYIGDDQVGRVWRVSYRGP